MNLLCKMLFALVILAALHVPVIAQQHYNFDMEEINAATRLPAGWSTSLTGEQNIIYPVKLDSVNKQNGRYSLSIEKAKEGGDFGASSLLINPVFSGKRVKLTGWLKTENVTGGYAGLWMRIDGTDGLVAFDNMGSRGITGTTEWKQYTIDLQYNEQKATAIYFGGLLTGGGKIWIDNFELLVDNRPLEKAPLKKIVLTKAAADTVFNNTSGIQTIPADKETVDKLTNLGMLWGFLKYYHPAIAKGDHNWDAELFRVLPKLLAANGKEDANRVLEEWVDALGKPDECHSCKEITQKRNIKLMPDYGYIFNKDNFSQSLVDKLTWIKNNRSQGKQYYFDTPPGAGNPEFSHENPYKRMIYPDAGYRLLTLYRYWNIIQYFFPDKHLIGEDWNKILPEFIPAFTGAADTIAYDLAVLRLICRVHDTHANPGGTVLSNYFGKYFAPVQAKFIEGKLVVTGYYTDSAGIKDKLKPGDIITKVNGVKVEDILKQQLPLTPASNYETQLRDLPRRILRSPSPTGELEIERDGKNSTVAIQRYEYNKLKNQIDYDPHPADSSYKLINGNIGYVFPGKYYNRQLPAIKELFKDTKGIIVDMRCYPSEFMPFTFGSYIKPSLSHFVKFTKANVDAPGIFDYSEPVSNGGHSAGYYKGKIIVIVNALTQSQAEYTTIAFQSGPNTTVIGSTTAGADGNVSGINLPGNIFVYMSGIGVLYPDGTETQRAGVKIDIPVQPTIKGIKEGRDELLEKAIELINK